MKITLKEEDLWKAVEQLASGSYYIDYRDATHLAPSDWIQLLKLDLHKLADKQPEEGPEQVYQTSSYSVKTAVVLPTWEGKGFGDKETSVLLDHLSQSFVRTGIQAPILARECQIEIEKLKESEACIVIPDTNALNKGTLHWLLQALADIQMTILPIVVSLITVQDHHARLNGLQRDERNPGRLRSAIRSRTLVNSSLGLLEKCKDRYQVFQVDNSLLRYVKGGGKSDNDPDRSDVFEDRLMIEAIHEVLRSSRSSTPKRVITSDALLSRLLSIEAIPNIFMQVPIIKMDSSFECIRYDNMAQKFLGAPLPSLLWDLVHVFSQIRIRNVESKTELELCIYWPGKTAAESANEFCQLTLPEKKTNTKPVGTKEAPAGKLDSGEPLSNASFPPTALLPLFQVLRSLARRSSVSIDDVWSRSDNAISETITLNAIELLRRMDVVKPIGGKLELGTNFSAFTSSFIEHDIDELSKFFERLPQYRSLLAFLRENNSLPRLLEPELNMSLGGISALAYKRLRLYPVYLGQAYSSNGNIVDGSARPSTQYIAEKFRMSFALLQRNNQINIVQIMPALAKELRIAPYILGKQIANCVKEGLLTEFSFESAASPKMITADSIISGDLQKPALEPVPLDRIFLKDRPVFTITRRF